MRINGIRQRDFNHPKPDKGEVVSDVYGNTYLVHEVGMKYVVVTDLSPVASNNKHMVKIIDVMRTGERRPV